ncbi:transglycosylase domain-containing protein [Microbacterium sp. P05]|uniref:transglycosylase domain-containing protein n=1 Tax=Microbacterium sp. P05 TaxID=3366948 RepID=UPI003745FE77
MPDKNRTPTGALGGLLGLVGLSVVAGVLVTATVTPAIAVSGAAASSAITLFDNMPSILKIDELMQPTTIVMGDVRTTFYDQNREPVDFNEVAPVMYDAILSSEDPRYYQHGGVDLIGTTRALLSNAQGGQTQGGSSISQQYVKNVLIQQCERDATDEVADDGTLIRSRDVVLQDCWMEATNATGAEGYERKLQEMRYAIQLEKEYSKNDILLGYLNIANFGRTTYGIQAAAKYYFNVPASELTLGQAATLAGIVQNPNTYKIDSPDSTSNGQPDGVVDAPAGTLAALDSKLQAGAITQEQYTAAADGYSLTKGRQLYVLSRLLDDGKITQEQYDAAILEPISPTITNPQTGCESTGAMAYFCAYVVSTIQNDVSFGATPEDRTRALRQAGLTIYTTLDPRIQAAAEKSISDYAPQSMPNTKYGATIVNLESKTGRVLAIAQNTVYTAGSSDDPNASSIVYAGDPVFGASAGFQAGSTFKLFTLIDWLEKGHSVNESVNGRSTVIKKFNSCDGPIYNSTWKANNFDRGGGYTGTPMRFTKESLNSGFVAMAAQLDLCDIGNVASRLGVDNGSLGGSVLNDTATPIKLAGPAGVIGDAAVSPMAMAGAYATIANGGSYCKPQVIDRVTNADGADVPEMIPARGCTQAITPEVAATAAYALQGVMVSGGTGSRANPNNGVPVLGKTGSHELKQTWMIESSTNVTTAVWAGNANGDLNPFKNYYRGRVLSDIRYPLAKDVQAVANDVYGGDKFPAPDTNLSREIQKDVPNVVGQTIDQAQATLSDAGFEVQVGDPVDSNQPTNVVAAQNPSGRAPAGGTITISPSNGEGVAVPAVSGNPGQAAQQLQSAGFTNIAIGTCAEAGDAPAEGAVTGTNPGTGTVVNRGTQIALDIRARDCP